MKQRPGDIYRLADLRVVSPSAYNALRFLSLCRRRLLRTPHDPDFRYFERHADVDGTFVDVGANGGQAAVSFSIFNKRARIVSFEPNPGQEMMLKAVRRLLGKRFRYEMIGLSDEPGTLPLFVPYVGNLPVSTRASLDRATIERYIDEQPAPQRERMSVREVSVELKTFDSLGLEPTFVKIDVEGAEPRVLRGMRQSLKRHRPIVMLESSESLSDATHVLDEVGYDVFVLCEDDKMRPLDDIDWNPTNVFALPR